MSEYAGIVTRFSALIVDAVLLAVVVPVVATGPSSLWEALEGDSPGWLKTCSQIAAGFLPILYFALCWWGTGQTLGGLLFGTVVRRPDRAHLSLPRALLRAIVGLLVPLIWLIGMVMVLWDDRRRALHDRLFGTVVLRKVSAIHAG